MVAEGIEELPAQNILKISKTSKGRYAKNPHIWCMKNSPSFYFRVLVRHMPCMNNLAPRQRWMLYLIYGSAGLVFLGVVVLFVTLNETRLFIGDHGVEICWMYGSFDRYLFTNLALICLDTGVMVGLYWLARLDNLLVYVMVWVVWWICDSVLSFFDMSYC